MLFLPKGVFLSLAFWALLVPLNYREIVDHEEFNCCYHEVNGNVIMLHDYGYISC
jgi:hypothetical protein